MDVSNSSPPKPLASFGFPSNYQPGVGWLQTHKDTFACVDLECQQSAAELLPNLRGESRFSVGTPVGNYNHQFAEGQHQPMSALVF